MFEHIAKYYNGFYIDQPVGNNAFSYNDRNLKQIYVPPAIKGNLSDLEISDQVVFSEIDEGYEINRSGLKNFVYWENGSQKILIFDNHNHAFFFWIAGLQYTLFKKGLPLVHIDQHKDMRKPERSPTIDILSGSSLGRAFEYTNFHLNVGNFIPPALELGLFSEIRIIDSSTDFETKVSNDKIILDIDIDIFADEMDYIDDDSKIATIRQYLKKSSFVTIATSPYFINQQVALQKIHEIFE